MKVGDDIVHTHITVINALETGLKYHNCGQALPEESESLMLTSVLPQGYHWICSNTAMAVDAKHHMAFFITINRIVLLLL